VSLAARLAARARALPGVTSAAIGSSIPPDAARMRFTLPAAQTAAGVRDLSIDAVAVTAGYFRTLRIGLESGRLFSDADTAGAPPVMIVSRATARRIFGDRDPIGLSLTLPTPSGARPVRVVGVVSNVKFDGLAKPSDGGVYRPFAQQPLASVFLVASSTAPIESLSRTIASVDPQICILESGPLRGRVARATSAPRFRAMVIGGVALLGLAMAVAGVFGVVSYSVVMRTAELGVRCAVGAAPADIIRLVLREAGAMAIAGSALGVAAAVVVTRGLASLLFGIEPGDPLSFAVGLALVVVLTLVAAYVPARRASRVDVMTALRN
jgi:ABC-type antimicrobial peptide transport system permease subunit